MMPVTVLNQWSINVWGINITSIRLKYYSDPNHGEKLPVESYLLEVAGLQDDRILQYSFLRVPRSEKRGVRWTLLWLCNFPGLSANDLDFMSPVFSLGFIESVGGEEKKTETKEYRIC